MKFKIGDRVRVFGVDIDDAEWDRGEVMGFLSTGQVEVYWEVAECTYDEDPDDLIPYK